MANRSAYSGRSRSRSTHLARLSGSGSVSSAMMSAGAGKIPQRSSDDRRANSASVQAELGGMPSVLSLSKRKRSTRFRDGGGSQAGTSEPSGTVILATPTRPPNWAVIAASPIPERTTTLPASSTMASSGEFDWNRARRVTSDSVPSSYRATTRNCWPAFLSITTCDPGETSRPVSAGSPMGSNGIPWPIQRFRTRYSGESASSRLPPPCGMAAVGFLSIRLSPADAGKTRRPRPSRTRLS